MQNKNSENQHYVPKFVLKRFESDTIDQIFVFDKKEGRIFKTNIKNIASETGLYNFEIEGERYSLEPALSKVESDASEIINDIVERRSIGFLSDENRSVLALFVNTQFTRTKASRERLKQMMDGMKDHLEESGIDPKKESEIYQVDDEEVKKLFLSSMADRKLMPYFLNKTWILFETTTGNPFYISDNPVVLQNTIGDSQFRGNLGLAVKGIEIYLPLSSTLVLAMICKSFEDTVRGFIEKQKILEMIRPGSLKELKEQLPNVERCLKAIETGCPFSMAEESVINHNSLQVIFSSRQVYSSKDNFDLVKEMIASDSRYKEGPGMEFN